MKKALLLLMTLLMLLTFTACNDDADYEPDLSNLPEIEGVDFEEEIDDYVEDYFNAVYLDVGEKGKHSDEIFLRDGDGECYSSDESVATVSDKGTITAKGKGTAYILAKTDARTEVNMVVVGKDKDMFNFVPDEMQGFFVFVMVFGAIITLTVITVIIVFIVKNAKSAKSVMNPAAPGFQNTVPQYQAPTNFGNPRCPHCGEQLESGSTFCPYCGGRMS